MEVHYKFFELLSRKNIQTAVTSKFEALPDTSSKLKYVQSLLKEHDLVPKIQVRRTKDDAVSKIHREAANTLYRERKYVDALVGYNKAICFADSEGLGFGYANRSAVYLELQLYADCLENVRLAKVAGYPEQMLSKLKDRETKCEEAISKRMGGDGEKIKSQPPKLSYPASSDNPSVADCIELVVNKKYGRHFVAKRDLKVGDIVILEKPYQVYLQNEYNYRKCANCLSENQLNLIPCPGCTKTMFCSRSCLEDAHKFHKTICPIIDRIFERPSSHMFFTLRVLLSLMQDFGSVKALAAARDSRLANSGLPKYSDDEKTRQKNALDAFHNMEVVFTPLGLKDAVSLALVYSWLVEYTDLAVHLPDTESQDLFLDLFFRYGRISEANAHATDIMDRDYNGMIANVSFASNILPIISLLNHSCAPNTIGISCNESLMAAMIERPVKKSEQLFISYGAHHMQEEKLSRQQNLLKTYQFSCDCVACTKNYPTLFSLTQTKAPPELMMNSSDFYQLSDRKKALQKFKECSEYLEKNDSSYPSMGLYMVRIGMLGAFSTLCRNYTLSVDTK